MNIVINFFEIIDLLHKRTYYKIYIRRYYIFRVSLRKIILK